MKKLRHCRHAIWLLLVVFLLAPPPAFPDSKENPAEESPDPRIGEIQKAIAKLDQDSKTTTLALEAEKKETRRTGLKTKIANQQKKKRQLEEMLEQVKAHPEEADWSEIDEALRRARPFEQKQEQMRRREEMLRERND